MKERAFDHNTVREWMAVDEIEEMDLMTGSGYIHLERSEFPKILVQKFLNKWTIFLFCSILFSSNQKEH